MHLYRIDPYYPNLMDVFFFREGYQFFKMTGYVSRVLIYLLHNVTLIALRKDSGVDMCMQ